MRNVWSRRCLVRLGCAIGASLLSFGSSLASDTPAHLEQARTLVRKIHDSSLNVYGGGKRFVDWAGHPPTARTVCSSFATLLLEHTYGWDDAYVKAWFGKTNPEANSYHDAIVDRKGFERIVHVSKIKPGDVLAIEYNDHHVSGNGVKDTGHVMTVDAIDEVETPKAPLVKGTKQYLVTVIDSSASGHGTTDTRYLGQKRFSGGIGRGIFRIYADPYDRVAGYTWSNEKRSPFYSAPDRDLVVGRLKQDHGSGN